MCEDCVCVCACELAVYVSACVSSKFCTFIYMNHLCTAHVPSGSRFLWLLPCVDPRIPDPVPPSKYTSVAFPGELNSTSHIV